MTRDLQKAIDQHERMYDETTGKACFYHSDYTQLFDLAARTQDGRMDLFDLMSKCLAAGYAIGYRTGQRDARKVRR